MTEYNKRLETFRSYNPHAQEYLMNKAERIATMIWKSRTYMMPPLDACMLVIR